MEPCSREAELQTMEVYLQETQNRLIRIEDKLDTMARMQGALEVLCNDYVHIQEQTQGLAAELKDMNERTVKNWRKALGAIFAAALSALASAFLR